MSDSRISRHALLVTSVTVLAIFLNGATTPLVRTAVIALMAATIVVSPSTQRGNRWLSIAAILAVICSLASFLPASWFGTQPWRVAATELGIELPNTISPTPLLSAESICLLVSGLVWLYYLSTLAWSEVDRKQIVRALGTTSAILGAAYIALSHFETPWPRPAYNEQFGPFANKNQTGSVLMLGGILIAGLINLPGERRVWAKLGWGAALAIVIVALVTVGSRSALILFICGALFVSIRRSTIPSLAVAGSIAMLGITGLILSKANVLSKFSGDDGIVSTTTQNGRWALYSDSLNMTMQSPLTGVGAGNFEQVFALHRTLSAAPNRALHPDSDVIWLIAEFGLPAALMIGIFSIGLFSLAFPFSKQHRRSRREHSLRIACLTAAVAFAINAFIDVPIHRFGALLPGALILTLATNQVRRRECTSSLQRFALGGCAIGSLCALLLIPHQPGLLDAEHHLTEAQEHLSAGHLTEAGAAFERARFLHPDNAKLALDEGNLWLDHSPMRAISVWRVAIERASRHGKDGEMFTHMFQLANHRPELLEELSLLAKGKPNLQVIALERGSRHNLDALFDSNPNLKGWNHDQISSALHQFSKHRSSDELVALVEANPSWAHLCWRPLAEAFGEKGDHVAAFQIITSSFPPPDLSILQTPLTISALRSEFARTPNHLTTVLRLAHQHMRQGNSKRALEMLNAVEKPSPPIVQFMIAHCFAKESSHDLANKALLAYVEQIDN